MQNLDSIPKPNPNIAGRVVVDEAVLVHPEKGKVQVLNEVGAMIWEFSDGSHTVAEIVAEVCRQFEVDQTTAQVDTLEFLADLVKREIITLD
jgi:hypothetical protein